MIEMMAVVGILSTIFPIALTAWTAFLTSNEKVTTGSSYFLQAK